MAKPAHGCTGIARRARDNRAHENHRLRPGKERSLLRRNPWIFESAIAKGGGPEGEYLKGLVVMRKG